MAKWYLSLIFVALVILFSVFLTQNDRKNKINFDDKTIHTQQINKKKLPRIAHGGGMYEGAAATDSLEALNANAAKYELFELDFNLTSDDELVCIHDWNEYGEFRRTIWPFWKKSLISPDLKTFKRLASEKQKWTNCTLNSLIKWLDDNPEKRIVTDVKINNIKILTYITKNHSTHIQRFIPQIYKLNQWKAVKSLGYNDIILTLYELKSSKKKRRELAKLKSKNYKLFAITILSEHVPKFSTTLKEINIPVYTHTVNDQAELDLLKTYGVDEIYTDSLVSVDMYSVNNR